MSGQGERATTCKPRRAVSEEMNPADALVQTSSKYHPHHSDDTEDKTKAHQSPVTSHTD